MEHPAIVIVDLGFGDSGKGTLTDALVRRHDAGLVVRYNGGAQAAHTVVTPDGRRHVFHQFGSGTFVPGVRTLLGRDMLVNPLLLFWEEQDLRTAAGVTDAWERITIDAAAPVTTPYHVIANRLREAARGAARHGSCGLGIGETVADALELGCDAVLRMADLSDLARLRGKLLWHRAWKRSQLAGVVQALRATGRDRTPEVAGLLRDLESDDEFEATLEVYAYVAERVRIADGDAILAAHVRRPGATIFEGAQGVLLDQDWGFHPHTTWSDTTPAPALALLRRAGFDGRTTVLGALRAYQTRHGAGPFPSEDAALTHALPDPSNPENPWQGAFRVGWLDLTLARYALRAAGRVDALALTCLDQMSAVRSGKVADGYRLAGAPFPLTPAPPACLECREALSRALRHVTVEYRDAPADPGAYASFVADQLALPLAITSWGPTSADKRFESQAMAPT